MRLCRSTEISILNFALVQVLYNIVWLTGSTYVQESKAYGHIRLSSQRKLFTFISFDGDLPLFPNNILKQVRNISSLAREVLPPLDYDFELGYSQYSTRKYKLTLFHPRHIHIY